VTPPLIDTYGRIHRSLRLSITDRCNFRCPYCMPARDVVFLPRSAILTYDEFETLTRIGAALGIREVRVTGGEPLVRRDVPVLIRKLATVEGMEDLALTTNAFYLEALARPLRDAGLMRINVSLDTLHPDRFRHLSGMDGLDRVLRGIESARQAGFSPLKINAVLIRGVNDGEILELAGWARSEGHSLRFIELMPIGGGPMRGSEYLVPGHEVRTILEERHPLVPKPGTDPSEPARTYLYADGKGEVGFINPMTEPFCGRCDRVRITADGKIRNCLFDRGELDLLGPLRSGAGRKEIEGIWRRAVRNKGPGGCLELGEPGVPVGARRMWQIGG
jgi:cyclic pyranopterin phosphate synthase